MNTTSTQITLARDLTREQMIVYLARVLVWDHGRRKSYTLATSMVDMLEAKRLRPRSGYLTSLIADTKTGEVHLMYDKKFSYLNEETKVVVKNLTYSRKVPWSKYKLRSS